MLLFQGSGTEVMIAQFHTLLFVIVLGNGINFTLGFCHDPYADLGQGLLWWPVSDASDLCA